MNCQSCNEGVPDGSKFCPWCGSRLQNKEQSSPCNSRKKVEKKTLVDAINNNDINAVQKLLKKGENPNSQDASGLTALMLATINNNYEIVNKLIEKGADINYISNGHTALYYAKPGIRDLLEYRGAIKI